MYSAFIRIMLVVMASNVAPRTNSSSRANLGRSSSGFASVLPDAASAILEAGSIPRAIQRCSRHPLLWGAVRWAVVRWAFIWDLVEKRRSDRGEMSLSPSIAGGGSPGAAGRCALQAWLGGAFLPKPFLAGRSCEAVDAVSELPDLDAPASALPGGSSSFEEPTWPGIGGAWLGIGGASGALSSASSDSSSGAASGTPLILIGSVLPFLSRDFLRSARWRLATSESRRSASRKASKAPSSSSSRAPSRAVAA
mmetsp:Transcript_57275/g.124545  ORF Transcript_57275/g.124545 Transcript_57275/m.124545 type:complete len:252 (+) Transcript_57275:1210-1965(+)